MPDREVRPGLWLCEHASIQLPDRNINLAWAIEILDNPEFVRPDLRHPGVMLAFGRSPEFGHRWIRVAFVDKEKGRIIVTAMFDRKAEKWR